jgi:hypothetical protein
MNTQILTEGHTYKVERINYGGNTGNYGGLILKGDTVSIAVTGSQSKPSYLSDMVDLIDGLSWNAGNIVAAGAYSFWMFPEYIHVSGTADAIEFLGYKAIEDLGLLPASPEA